MIDYEKIAAAVYHYETKGYKEIEVPWIISLDSMLITRPKGARLFSTFAGELVASGEQSFLEIRKQLTPGKYQCVTPCFRDEQIHDGLHHQYFIKNELIWVLEKDARFKLEIVMDNLRALIKDAKSFFEGYAKTNLVDSPLDNAVANQDIEINGIEVGSYGYRTYEDFHWIYGTGCAEPRLSQALN